MIRISAQAQENEVGREQEEEREDGKEGAGVQAKFVKKLNLLRLTGPPYGLGVPP